MDTGVGHGNSVRALVARVKAGKPIYAWDDPSNVYSNNNDKDDDDDDEHQPTAELDAAALNAAGQEIMTRDEINLASKHLRHHCHQPSFYDREALEEKLNAIQETRSRLTEKELGLRDRLVKAEAALTAMRAKKRQLSTAKMLDEVSKHKTAGKAKYTYNGPIVESSGLKENTVGDRRDRSGGNSDERAQQREEQANVRIYVCTGTFVL